MPRIFLPVQEPQEKQVQSLGWEDPLEEEMAAHSSILARIIPWTEELSRLQFMGSESDTTEVTELMHTHTHTHTHACIYIYMYMCMIWLWGAYCQDLSEELLLVTTRHA